MGTKRGRTKASSTGPSSSSAAAAASFYFEWVDSSASSSSKRQKSSGASSSSTRAARPPSEARGDTINARDVYAEHDAVNLRVRDETELLHFRKGDFAMFYLGDSSQKAYKQDRQNEWVGQLEMLWEDRWGTPNVQIRWFYYPEETVRGRLPFQDKREVHVTYHIDDNPLDSISGKAVVLSYEDFQRYQANEEVLNVSTELMAEISPENIFFSKNFYDPVIKLFRPVSADELLPRNQRSKIGSRSVETAFSSSVGHAETSDRDDEARFGEDDEVLATQRKVDDAKSKLHLSAIPEKLPCRDKERKQIEKYLSSSIRQGGIGRSLYIAGMPGTGKTAIVSEIIQQLQAKAGTKSLPYFQYLAVNAMKLHHPYQLYTILYQAITKGRATHARAASWLDNHFSKHHDGPPFVLLVDELDFLVTKKQTVLYNIFEWPTRPNSKLIVIGISNTIDLPERMLPKVQSRLGLERVQFVPYTSEQISTIVRQRLEDIALFDSDAVTMVSKKVSRFSGDVRRALQICSRAVDLCFDRWKQERHVGRNSSQMAIKIKDIQSASKALEGTQVVRAIRGLSEWEKYLLSSLALQLRADNSERASMLSVYRRCKVSIQQELQDQLDLKDATHVVNRLIEYNLVSPDHGKEQRYPHLQLNLQIDDIAIALSAHPFISQRLQASL
eukprot:gb/GECG01002907.1/.p1 GENE.gb/GECG01002907.1/~~gb/GECG01002907.1/.p1  ORF type:complete len:670 (+),score=100.16 gb/GECG01002907.1/:1-2010(+)